MNQTTHLKEPNLLEVKGLKTCFYSEDGPVTVLEGVDLSVKKGEVLGLVGESGCGKSMTSMSVMRLLGRSAYIDEGSIIFDGKDLTKLSESEMTKVRGKGISIIFQQAQASLDPVYKVGSQIVEAIQTHSSISKRDAWNQAVELLDMVGIPDPSKRAHCYPHELSGGMAQRVGIAIALSCGPKLLFADEPTTALDVTIQAQILDLLRDLIKKFNMGVVLISHDLGVIAEAADRIAIMYAGKIVEEADTETLFNKPMHPYTQGLLASMPILGKIKDRLYSIPGSVIDLKDISNCCSFNERCVKDKNCRGSQQKPRLVKVEHRHKVRCWRCWNRIQNKDGNTT
jgi:oligopeptide/dipeptide ABC transporter ATP-binding protein